MSTPKTYTTWSDAETDALLEWLSVPANCLSYRTGTKTKVCVVIAEALKTKTASQVDNKIKNMTRDYKKAIDWRKATGRGVEGAGGTIEAELNQRCPRFADLDDIFGTRPNLNPPSDVDFLVTGDGSEAVVAAPERDLLSTDEANNPTPTAAKSGHREASPEVSPLQSKRGKPMTAGIPLGTLTEQQAEVDKVRMELMQKQFQIECEERERRRVADEKQRAEERRERKREREDRARLLTLEEENRKHRMALEKEERKHRRTLEKHKMDIEERKMALKERKVALEEEERKLKKASKER
jgi:hypothetical protein